MNRPHWETLAIVGVGLIGGSIGLAARQRGLARTVVGIGRRETSLRVALDAGTVTDTTTDLARGVSQADLIVVCTPVDLIARHVADAATHASSAALITDAGSTKADVVRQVEAAVEPATRFIGSHPLAGSHESGAAAATPELLEGRTVVITPTDKTRPHDADEVSQFWSALGANVVRMDAEAHDEAIAASSHVPHVVAAALAKATPEQARQLVAGGWLDTTRIASADPRLWVPILLDNRAHVLASIDRFSEEMATFRKVLQDDDAAAMQRWLDQGKQSRDAIGN